MSAILDVEVNGVAELPRPSISVVRQLYAMVLGVLVLTGFPLGSIEAAETNSPPCTCGSNVRVYLEAEATGVIAPATTQPAWCAKEGLALLDVAYGRTPKIPSGFRGNAATNFEQVIAVNWVTHPSPPIEVGPYRVNNMLSAAATLDEARQAVLAFERDSGFTFPHLRGSTILRELEQRFYFEFQFPSDYPPYVVVFRIWKTSFLMPTTFGLLPDGYRTGMMSIGHVSKHVTADDVSLFLEEFWWENGGNSGGTKVLAIPKVSDTPVQLLVEMQVLAIHGGDIPDEVHRDVWTMRVNRRTGEIVRDIEPDIICQGRASRWSPRIVTP